ncbi:MAG: hypothetical protein U1A77_18660 [Pirellulales bacterium]
MNDEPIGSVRHLFLTSSSPVAAMVVLALLGSLLLRSPNSDQGSNRPKAFGPTDQTNKSLERSAEPSENLAVRALRAHMGEPPLQADTKTKRGKETCRPTDVWAGSDRVGERPPEFETLIVGDASTPYGCQLGTSPTELISHSSAASPYHQTKAPSDDSEIGHLAAQLEELQNHQVSSLIKLECVIATVSDPIDSHYALSFDGQLAAMTSALGQFGYVLDRYELAWSQDSTNSPLYEERASAVLLRRTSRDSCKVNLCMLLLVGETPTSGVHPRALRDALNFVAAWNRVRDPRQSNPTILHVNLLAPCYSGSSLPLQRQLVFWSENSGLQRIHIKIRSGSATADDNFAHLNVDCTLQRTADAKRAPSPSELSLNFQACVNRDSRLLSALRRYLHSRLIEDKQIALLTESSTGYTSNISLDGPKLHNLSRGSHLSSVPVSKDCFEPGQAMMADGPNAAAEPRPLPWLTIPYPLSVSRIRSEQFQRQNAADSPENHSRFVFGARPTLHGDVAEHANDVPPYYSDDTNAVAELILQNILRTITRENIKAVGIMGTDVRDKLFLARHIRDHAPDVILFTLESDVLYLHSDFWHATSGMVVASSYPLFPPNQNWTTPLATQAKEGRQVLHFGSDSLQGVYNAMLLLAPKPPGASPPLLEYSFPFTSKEYLQPPVWISVVRDGGFWPMDIVDEGRDTYLSQEDSRQEPKEKRVFLTTPPSSFMAFWTVTLGVVITCFLLAASSAGKRGKSRESARHALVERYFPALALPFAKHSVKEEISHSYLYTATSLGVVSLALAQLVVVSPHILYLVVAKSLRVSTDSPLEFAVSFVCVAVSLVVVLLLVVVQRRIGQDTSGHITSGLLDDARKQSGRDASWFTWNLKRVNGQQVVEWISTALLASLLFLIPALLVLEIPFEPLQDSIAKTMFFVERAGTLSSGVSPIAPLTFLLAAVSVWAIAQLRRIWTATVYPMASPFSEARKHSPRLAANSSNDPSVYVAGFDLLFAELRKNVQGGWFWPFPLSDWVIVALGTYGIVDILCMRWIVALEATWCDIGLRTLVGLVIILWIGAVIRAKAVTTALLRLLRRLSQHPIQSAFARVPERIAAKAAGQLFALPPKKGDFEPSLRILEQLADIQAQVTDQRSLLSPPDKEKVDVEQLEQTFARLVETPREQRWLSRQLANKLHTELAIIAREYLVPELSDYWSGRPTARRNASEDRPGDDHSQDATLRFRLAEEFIAIQLADVIRQTFVQLQIMMTSSIVVGILLLMCLNSYPFEPQKLLNLCCFGLLAWNLGSYAISVIHLNRNETLSRLGNTPPNSVSFDRTLFLSMLVYVVAPLLGILNIWFPVFGGSWRLLDQLTLLLRT